MWTLRLIWQYLVFLWFAKPPSKLHSPYLFELLMEAFDSEKAYYVFGEIELSRALLVQSEQLVSVGHGAGSKKHPALTVGDFALTALSSPRQCEILFRLVNRVQPRVIVEVGSALGISTAYLASAAPSARVNAFEGNPVLVNNSKQTCDALGLSNVEFITGDFDATLKPTLERLDPVDFAFIDGNHRLEPTVRYFKLICENASDEALIILDDIRWSPEMFEAWQEICSHDRVRVSIDAFSFGMVFLSKRFKDREHFKIAPKLMHGGPVLG